MKAISMDILNRLDLEAAIEAEASCTRNLLPPEPWMQAVYSNKQAVANYLRTKSATGGACAQNVVVSTRKLGHGIRPVPVMGIAERMIYRALGDLVLSEQSSLDRSMAAYEEFVGAPIKAAFEGTGIRKLKDARFSHVVESDITAFYQYVDHGILRDELDLQTGQVDAVDALTDLLKEVQGRSFGLPQLFDTSDALSEIYAATIERDIIRMGVEIWRYNDDFRIGARDYSDALDSIELLERSARSLGLVLADHKTVVRQFFNYMVKNLKQPLDESNPEFDPSDIEVNLVDYPVAEGPESVESALGTLARLDETGERRIDLKNVDKDEVRDIRRAVNALTKEKHPGGLQYMRRLYSFTPWLTPRIIDYLTCLASAEADECLTVWGSMCDLNTLSEWQSLWLLYAGRQIDALQRDSSRIDWAHRQRERSSGSLLEAEACLALAQSGAVEFSVLDERLRYGPSALAPWYVMSMGALRNVDTSVEKSLGAVRQVSPLFRVLLKE